MVVDYINPVYNEYGKNKAGLFVALAFYGGSRQECQSYASGGNSAKTVLQYRVIAGQEGGGKIHEGFKTNTKLSVCVINPDAKVVEKDIWPINSAEDVRKVLKKYPISSTGALSGNMSAQPVPFVNLTATSSGRLRFIFSDARMPAHLSLWNVRGVLVWSQVVQKAGGELVLPVTSAEGHFIVRIEHQGKSVSLPVRLIR